MNCFKYFVCLLSKVLFELHQWDAPQDRDLFSSKQPPLPVFYTCEMYVYHVKLSPLSTDHSTLAAATHAICGERSQDPLFSYPIILPIQAFFQVLKVFRTSKIAFLHTN